MITVENMLSDEKRYYDGITAREAVIAAYAQSKGDWNTWDYVTKYGDLVFYSPLTVSCGDYCAFRTDITNEEFKERVIELSKEYQNENL